MNKFQKSNYLLTFYSTKRAASTKVALKNLKICKNSVKKEKFCLGSH